MKQSSYLKMLATALVLINTTAQNVYSKEQDCSVLFNAKTQSEAVQKALQLNNYPIWVERIGNNFQVVATGKDLNCEIDFSSVVAKTDFISLTALGYYDDIYIEGSSPYFQIYFPIYQQFISGRAIFDIEISPLVKEDSVIAVKINDKVVKLIKVKDFGYTGKIEIPITDIKNKKFIKISIDGDLKVGRTICDDINVRNVYLRINPYKSGFIVAKKVDTPSIKSFFYDYSKTYYIDELNLKSIKFFYYIPSANGWLKADVKEFKNIKRAPKIIYTEKKTSLAKIEKLSIGNSLTIGNPDIVSTFVVKSILIPEISTSEVNKNKIEFEKNIITLKQLGVDNLSISGVGVLSFYIPFNTAMIGGIPDNLKFYMFLNHSAIDEHDRAFLEIYVNNNLVNSYQLKYQATKRKGYIIDIPKSLLGAGLNKVDVKISYYPSSDRCIGAVPKINVSLDSNSYFKWNETIKKVYKVRDFLNIVNGKVAVVVDGKQLLKPASHILEVLGKINPNITKLDVYKDYNELNPDNYDYIIMFLTSNKAKTVLNDKNVPLKIDEKGFSIFDVQTGKKLFKLGFNDSIGFIEVIDYKKKPTLVVSYINSSDVLKDIRMFNPVNVNGLLGNLVLFKNGDYSVYNIGSFVSVEYTSEKGLIYYWNNYKVLIISVLAIFVILFEIFVMKKLVRRKKNG